MHSLVNRAPNLRPFPLPWMGYDGCYAIRAAGEQNAECTVPSLAFVASPDERPRLDDCLAVPTRYPS